MLSLACYFCVSCCVLAGATAKLENLDLEKAYHAMLQKEEQIRYAGSYEALRLDLLKYVTRMCVERGVDDGDDGNTPSAPRAVSELMVKVEHTSRYWGECGATGWSRVLREASFWMQPRILEVLNGVGDFREQDIQNIARAFCKIVLLQKSYLERRTLDREVCLDPYPGKTALDLAVTQGKLGWDVLLTKVYTLHTRGCESVEQEKAVVREVVDCLDRFDRVALETKFVANEQMIVVSSQLAGAFKEMCFSLTGLVGAHFAYSGQATLNAVNGVSDFVWQVSQNLNASATQAQVRQEISSLFAKKSTILTFYAAYVDRRAAIQRVQDYVKAHEQTIQDPAYSGATKIVDAYLAPVLDMRPVGSDWALLSIEDFRKETKVAEKAFQNIKRIVQFICRLKAS